MKGWFSNFNRRKKKRLHGKNCCWYIGGVDCIVGVAGVKGYPPCDM
jgi:hypothetical protein